MLDFASIAGPVPTGPVRKFLTRTADYCLNGHGLLRGGALGGGFGYAGSTGAMRGAANLRTLAGLEEGFQRLQL